jgi:dihydrofolate reductase
VRRNYLVSGPADEDAHRCIEQGESGGLAVRVPANVPAELAGRQCNVCVMGGAKLAQQYLKAGLIDEINIHLMPVIFGVGARLFGDIGAAKIELDQRRVTGSPNATHLRLRVCR